MQENFTQNENYIFPTIATNSRAENNGNTIPNNTFYGNEMNSTVKSLEESTNETGGDRKMSPLNGGANGARQQQAQPKYSAINDKNKVTPLAHLLIYSEDMRISKILRRLVTENNPSSAVDLCKKLDIAVRSQSNISYIRRSFDFLLENLHMVLKQCPIECLEQASTTLGLIGYINREDFAMYKNFITKAYQNKSIQKYLMLALKTTLACDAVNLNLQVYSERLLIVLKDYLENAEQPEQFIAVCETIAEFSKNYKNAFENHFTDIVDIVVGWHLEVEQPQKLKLHCAAVLQQFSPYFLKELDFTYGLLGQFLEDIVSHVEELETENDKTQIEARIVAFIGAFNAVLKALTIRMDCTDLTTSQNIIKHACEVIVKAAHQTLHLSAPSEESILNFNDFLSLIFAHNYGTFNMQSIEDIIALQLKHLKFYNEPQILSLLYLMFSILRQLRTNLSLSFVTMFFNTNNNPLASLKLCQDSRVYKLLLKIYHEVLMIKNVPVLQEAYKHIKSDVDVCVSTLENRETNIQPFVVNKAESNLNFYFAALAALATQTSSIISMYALNPSILELLINNCKAANMHLWCNYGTLQCALLNLLIVHCQKNHNFRTTSRLVTQEQHYAKHALEENNSPTSEHFSLILKFLAGILQQSNLLSIEVLTLLLSWLKTLYEQCQANALLLRDNEHFVSIGKSLCTAAALMLPLESGACIESLLRYNTLNAGILESMRDIAVYMQDALDVEVIAVYTAIYAKLPLGMSLIASTKATHLVENHKRKIEESLHWYKTHTHFAALRPKYFKSFLESLDFKEPQNLDALFYKYFNKCWTAQPRDGSIEYQQLTRASAKMLTTWLQYETARYCVNNKLRTTLGKPQDTFLAIEALITKYASILTSKDKSMRSNEITTLNNLLTIQNNARILLGFLECLEKHIYNAAEGTAFAVLAPEKPAKTFFRINAHTCNEWFKRIRTSVNMIASHCMEPEMIIRYAENILKMDKISDVIMDHTITSLVGALIQCKESDTLQGFHIWLRKKAGKRYAWIQFAAEQAAGRKEKAAEGYMNILNECGGATSSKADVFIKEFILEQLLDCLYSNGQWLKMLEIQQSHNTTNLTNTRSPTHLRMLNTLYYGYGHSAAASAEVSNALLALTTWPAEDEASSSIHEQQQQITYNNVVHKIEDSCMVEALKNIPLNISDELQQIIYKGIQTNLRHNCTYAKNTQLIDYLIIQKQSNPQLFDSEQMHRDYIEMHTQQVNVLIKCLFWTQMQQLGRQQSNDMHALDNTTRVHKLYLDIAAVARREGNYNFSSATLERYFALKGLHETLPVLSAQIQNDAVNINVGDTEFMRALSEMTKCQFDNNVSAQQAIEALNLAAAYSVQIIEQVEAYPEVRYPSISSNILLNMADCVTQRNSNQFSGSNSSNNNTNTLLNSSPQLQRLLKQLPEIEVHATDDNIYNIITPTEKAIGKLLNGSVNQKSDSAEAWCAFGNWCYRWGKKLVEAKNTETNAQKGNFSQRNILAIKYILGNKYSEDSITQLVAILNKHQLSEDLSRGVDEIDANEINSAELIENDLRKIEEFNEITVEQIMRIVEIWRQSHKSIYAYYELAARAYFKYLTIQTAQAAAPNPDHKNNLHIEDSTFVTITLRLLRLIVKHAIALQEVLEEGLETTPLRPWKAIIPQLFSRLNHHETYVRKSVSDLLCRLAQDRPHLVIFPAVVGARQELKDANILLQSEGGNLTQQKNNIALSNCFSSLLATLAKQTPETVLQVQLLVKELKRITLLWEEYWIHSVAQLYSEYSTLFNALEAEMKKSTNTAANHDVINAKYEVLMKYVVSDLEKIAAVTEKSAETNYEKNFHGRFSAFINNTISELHQPLNPNKPNEGWQRLKQLYGIFQQRSLRGSTSTLKVSDLSAVLANMRNTAISMPGIDTFEKNAIYIHSVDSTVYILPTKTKPKKLAFFGSDGRKYTYLFKGLEDLHLDERIMQFLSISNSMMARSNDAIFNTNNLKAHHYSVIPLGPQSGLISWVDGVTPLFSIYKRWQQRDIALKQQQKERPSGSSNAQRSSSSAAVAVGAGAVTAAPPTTRPSELFYNKLTPLLAEQNIKTTDPRKTWPLSTLRRVLESLIKDTPKDLLSKELWCNAVNAREWRKAVRNYSISVAVMSVIGYVIGLGDRHLDNVLIKLNTGEIVHIDYNVCFEKGKTLRVPERVPFRMTPNLEEALGITGVEGTFRLSCEHVLKTLRKERETLLTLLEAFVYDPLVDWAVSDDGTTMTTRTTSAHAAALSIETLKHRGDIATLEGNKSDEITQLQEQRRTDVGGGENIQQLLGIKLTWTKYRDDVHEKLKNTENKLKDLIDVRESIESAEHERDKLTKQLAMIHELEALSSARGSHALNTISQRYYAYKRDLEALNNVKEGVRTYHNDIEGLLETYFDKLLNGLANSELYNLHHQFSEQQQQPFTNEFELVRELLENSYQEQLYVQGDLMHKELVQLLSNSDNIQNCIECVQYLMKYVNVMQYYYQKSLQANHLVEYKELYEQLLDETQTVAVLQQEFEEFLVAQHNKNGDEMSKARAFEYALAIEKVWFELNVDYNKIANDLKYQKEKMLASAHMARNDIINFQGLNYEYHTQILRLCMLATLEKANASFLSYEETALKSGDAYLLEQQIDYVEMTHKMYAIVYGIELESSFVTLELLGITLKAMEDLKNNFDLQLAERVARLFILDTQIELQQNLNIICTAATSACELYGTFETNSEDLLYLLLNDINNYFIQIERHLHKLEEYALEIVDDMGESSSHAIELVRSTMLDGNNKEHSYNWKWETITNVFRIARNHTKSLADNNSLECIYDIRLLSTPVSDYINHLQHSFVGGLTSLFACALHNKLSAALVPSTAQDDEVNMLHGQTLCQNLFMELQHNATLKHYELQLMQQSAWIEHYTAVATAHYWLNSQLLRDSNHVFDHIMPKSNILYSLKCLSDVLRALKQTALDKALEIEAQTNVVIQQLRYHSASQQHAEYQQQLLKTFSDCAAATIMRSRLYAHAIAKLLEYIETLLHFELFQVDDAARADLDFIAVLKQYQETVNNCRQSAAAITPVEQAIVQLLDPEGKVDQCWIDNISGLLDEMTFAVQRKLANLEQQEKDLTEELLQDGKLLQNFSETPIRIRSLLKSINRNERNNSSCIRELQHALKLFYNKFDELQQQIIAHNYNHTNLLQMQAKIVDVLNINAGQHSEVMQIIQKLCENTTNVKSNSPQPADNNVATDVQDKKVEQKRNAYAVSVWKRIRMKLEGRDPDSNRRSTIAEQVDYIIQEAMNPDNLAVLYEGWTPWV